MIYCMNNILEKVHQMFILGLEGPNLKDNPNLINALHNGLGGVIFFTQNIKTTKQFKTLIQNIKKQSKISPFLSIDQEGGRVERTENIFGGKKYLSAKYAAEKGEIFLKEQTEQISQLLNEFGINLNYSPVLDVSTNPDNPIIGERAYSNNTDEVIKFGKIVVDTYLKNGIIPCSKHFPGHGDASADSHKTLPVIHLSLAEMEECHIKPFKEVEAPMIMVAHLHCLAFDQQEIPSSLSINIISYLKDKLNYNGLIITDDMNMGGVLNINGTEACVRAIKAGVNILLYRGSDKDTVDIIDNIAKLALKDSELALKIEESYNKILEFKDKFLK